MVTLKEYADKEGISKTAAQKRVKLGQVKGSQVGGKWFVEVPTTNLKPPTIEQKPPTRAELSPTAYQDRQPYPKADGRFLEIGRGIPVDGQVRVSFDPTDDTQDRMIPESEWRVRLVVKCVHGLFGWSCTDCLNDRPKPVKANRLNDEWEKRISAELGPLYLTNEFHTLNDGRRVQLKRRAKEPKPGWVLA